MTDFRQCSDAAQRREQRGRERRALYSPGKKLLQMSLIVVLVRTTKMFVGFGKHFSKGGGASGGRY